MASLLGALGDVHGDFATVRRIMHDRPEVRRWVSVGDLADDCGHYEPLPAPLHWIKGNNENFDAIAEGRLPGTCRFLPSAEPRSIGRLLVAGLGGTFAPTWYDTPARDLPHPQKGSARATALADKRRHFVREEVEACKRLQGIDVLLTHEAARPYRVGRIEAGKGQINEVLAAMRPRLHLFGHHHRFSDQVREGIRSIGLDHVSTSYLLIDEATLGCERVSQVQAYRSV
jgi:uncharacterized protein